jgi:hypothetical protein
MTAQRTPLLLALAAWAAPLSATLAWSGRAAADVEVPATPTQPTGPTTSAPAPPLYGEAPVLIEQMPPSAYPEPKPRGIPGGSLWLTFHGLQWPYYPKTGVGVGGYVWIDTGYEEITRDQSRAGTIYWLQQGRAVLRLTPTYTAGSFFIQGQAELVANKDQRATQPNVADTDDLWVRTGSWNAWDLQLGRYEPWELYHLGMGLDLNTIERRGAEDPTLPVPPDFYGLYGYLRPSGYGNAALHLYGGALTPRLDFVRVELLGHFGYENLNLLGGRPTVVLDFGWLKLKWGGVARIQRPRDAKITPEGEEVRYEKWFERGTGGAIQAVFAPHVEMGVSGTIGLADHWDPNTGGFDVKGSHTIWSAGGFANFRLPVALLEYLIVGRGESGGQHTSLRPLVRVLGDMIVGGGFHFTDKVDLQRVDPMLPDEGNVGHQTNLQTFVALQYRARERMYIKLVGAYSRARWENLDKTTNKFENEMWSARLRFLYLF